jgi:hypothetical protein
VSLIFEALKKLEREKESPDRGVVVVAPGAWGEREPRSQSRTAAAIGLVLLGLGLAAFALRPRARATEPASAAATPAPAATLAPVPDETPVVGRSSDDVPPPSSRLVVPTAPSPHAAAAAQSAEPETIALTPPPDPVAPHEPEFRLNAISSREGQPVALLNDRLVREGDMFAGVRVLHIGEDYVEIEVKGERRTIRF